MLYPVTTAAAAILGLWLVVLSYRVIMARRSSGVSLGIGDSEILERRVRAQANFNEYVPMGLILLLVAETQSANAWVILVAAFALVIGRLLHGIAFGFTVKWVFGRFVGMLLTFAALIILIFTNVWLLIRFSV